MTKSQKLEYDGFLRAKRMIAEHLDNKLRIYEEAQGMEYLTGRQRAIKEIEEIKSYIRNVALFKIEG